MICSSNSNFDGRIISALRTHEVNSNIFFINKPDPNPNPKLMPKPYPEKNKIKIKIKNRILNTAASVRMQ
jgi:hypothetical protein